MASNTPANESPAPTRHTLVGVLLNLLLLAMIAYGFVQSERWRWAWILVAIPIAIVTARYALHLRAGRGREHRGSEPASDRDADDGADGPL